MDVSVLKKSVIPVLSLLFLAAITACTGESLDNRNSIGLAGFYDSATKKEVSIDSISVFGVGAPNDSMLVRNGRGVKQVYMPFRINASTVQFCFRYEQKALNFPQLNDTLTINYDPVPYFASKECGVMYIFSIKDFSCTSHLIDSVAIPTMKITNVDRQTIEIYFRTSNSN